MFYAIPLDSKPDWRNPPWMTVLLILVNMAVFWGPQRTEDTAEQKATAFYARSVLPALELPAFLDHLDAERVPQAAALRRAYQAGHKGPVLDAMEHDTAFMARLRAGGVVPAAHAQHAEWQADRARYEQLRPAPFTDRWAQDFRPDAPARPVTWLTAAFLHGSTGHLVGNMVFLFMFGFTLELAMGRTAYLGAYLLGAFGAGAMAAWAYGGQRGIGLGASGAVSALMAMYAVHYRLRRVRFFYQLFFYFNYARLPALVLLPAWIAQELLQHASGRQGVGYMTHLGGLLTGAAVMGAWLLAHRVRGAGAADAPPAQGQDDGHAAQVENARRLTGALEFDRACAAWRRAAALRPQDAATLKAWFHLARGWPDRDDFHHAARAIFRLRPHDSGTVALQHATYRTYVDLAMPAVRIPPDDMVRLAQRFCQAHQWEDVEQLCRALLAAAPTHPQLADTLCRCANGLLQVGLQVRARRWLPHLQRLAPDDAATRALA